MLMEISRECQNHKPKLTPDSKRKKKAEINACKINKRLHEYTKNAVIGLRKNHVKIEISFFTVIYR